MAEKCMAEVHGNRTHPPGCSPGTPDLKSGRATSALSTSTCFFSLIIVDPKNNFLLCSRATIKDILKEKLFQERALSSHHSHAVYSTHTPGQELVSSCQRRDYGSCPDVAIRRPAHQKLCNMSSGCDSHGGDRKNPGVYSA